MTGATVPDRVDAVHFREQVGERVLVLADLGLAE